MTTDLGPLDREPRNVRPPFDVRPPRAWLERGETSDQWRARVRADIVAALLDAIGPDVELGAYDRRIVEWLAGWDIGTVGTIASLLRRVRAAGETERGATEEPQDRMPPKMRASVNGLLDHLVATESAVSPAELRAHPSEPKEA